MTQVELSLARPARSPQWRPSRRLLPRRFLGPVALVLVWHAASSLGLLDPRTLPSPVTILGTGRDLLATGELEAALAVSLGRVAAGLSIGIAVGLLLALVAGLFRLGEDLVDSTMHVLRTLPVLALVPLLIVWLGIGEAPKIALIAIATTFPIYLNTFAAIRSVEDRYVEAATVLGLDRAGIVRHVILPGAMPGFLTGLRFSVSIAWLLLIVGEQINARAGLGYLMNQAREFFQIDVIVVGLVVYGILGLLGDAVVRMLERSLLGWRRNFRGT